MPVAQQRAPVIYVAGSARELPAEVQDWLGRADIRAVASPHVYDMLAQLARGKKFAAILVNIQSVDWTEMEFFDYASRLGGHVPIYVTGGHAQRAKLEAACRRGARLFDALALDEDLSPGFEVMEAPRSVAPSPVVAPPSAPESDALEAPDSETPESEAPRSMPFEPGSWPRVRLADDFEPLVQEPDEPQEREEIETGFIDEEQSSSEPDSVSPVDPGTRDSSVARFTGFTAPGSERSSSEPDSVSPVNPEMRDSSAARFTGFTEPGSERVTSPEPPPSPPESLPVSSSEPDFVSPVNPGTADGLVASPENPSGNDRPTVRLVAIDEPVDSDAPVVFPWSANPNRPKRTPPPAGAAPQVDPSESQASSPPPAPTNRAESPFKSVRLTAEEIAALMGPPRRQAPEGQS